MKMLLTALSIFALPVLVNAADTHKYTSEPGSIFCETLSDMETVIRYTEQGDKLALAKLFDSGNCAIVKPSLDLYIEEAKGPMAKIRRPGLTTPLWTHKMFLK